MGCGASLQAPPRTLPIGQPCCLPPLPGSTPQHCFSNLYSNPNPLGRVHVGPNEATWGRLWLEVPEAAAPDSVVLVTVAAVGEAGTAPSAHAYLRLVVLDPASQVRRCPARPAPGSPGPCGPPVQGSGRASSGSGRFPHPSACRPSSTSPPTRIPPRTPTPTPPPPPTPPPTPTLQPLLTPPLPPPLLLRGSLSPLAPLLGRLRPGLRGGEGAGPAGTSGPCFSCSAWSSADISARDGSHQTRPPALLYPRRGGEHLPRLRL